LELAKIVTGRIANPKIALLNQPKLWLFLLLVAYIVLALQYDASAPVLGLKPDEQWHLAYVEYVQKHRALPVVDLQESGKVGRSRWEPEGHQPPLYYALVALLTPDANLADIDRLYTPNPYFLGTARGNLNPWIPRTSQAVATLHAGRLISMAFGLLTLLATYGLARTFASSTVALLATAITGFNPQFLYISTSFSNDLAAAGICALVIWLTAMEIKRPPRIRRAFVLGILIGLATLAKLSGFVLVAAVPAIILASQLWLRSSDKSNWRLILYPGAVVAMASLIAMPWFAWNWRVYGNPFATPALYSLMNRREGLISMRALYDVLVFLWKGYWLDFSAGGILHAPMWLYLSYGIFLLCSAVGLLVAWRGATMLRPYLILCLFWVLLYAASLLLTMVRAEGLMGGGRLLFPVCSAVSVLAAVGILHPWPRRWKIPLALFLTALAVASAVYVWLSILKPAYDLPTLPLATADDLPNHSDSIRFGDGIWLDGWEIIQQDAKLGDTVGVTLYWHRSAPVSKDYSVFLQLWPLGLDLLAYKGVDTYPGLGLCPTSELPTDRILVDGYPLPVISLGIFEEPINARLEVGLYDLASGVRLPAWSDGRMIGDHAELGRITIRPSTPLTLPEGARLPRAVVFDTGIQLVGAEMGGMGGTEACVDLWWLGADAQRADLNVLVRALNNKGQAVAQIDGPPKQGHFPTSLWKSGDLVRDRHCFSQAPSAPIATLGIGLYEPGTLTSLKAYAKDGSRLTDDTAVLRVGP
jgi:4-amino-4-deoxy-L-arabinose transferase-like glycosyltransferase